MNNELNTLLALLPYQLLFIAISWLVIKFAEWEKRMNQDRLAFELALTGKVGSLKQAKIVVKKFWDYGYRA